MVESLLSPKKMQVLSWIYLLVLTIGSLVVFSWSFAWSVLAGGVISILSFLVSHRDIAGFLETVTPDQVDDSKKIKKQKAGFIIKFWFRFLIIGIVLFLLIWSHRINVFGLLLGLSTVVFTVTFTALSMARHYLLSGRR